MRELLFQSWKAAFGYWLLTLALGSWLLAPGEFIVAGSMGGFTDWNCLKIFA